MYSCSAEDMLWKQQSCLLPPFCYVFVSKKAVLIVQLFWYIYSTGIYLTLWENCLKTWTTKPEWIPTPWTITTSEYWEVSQTRFSLQLYFTIFVQMTMDLMIMLRAITLFCPVLLSIKTFGLRCSWMMSQSSIPFAAPQKPNSLCPQTTQFHKRFRKIETQAVYLALQAFTAFYCNNENNVILLGSIYGVWVKVSDWWEVNASDQAHPKYQHCLKV